MYLHTFVSILMGFLTSAIQKNANSLGGKWDCFAACTVSLGAASNESPPETQERKEEEKEKESRRKIEREGGEGERHH